VGSCARLTFWPDGVPSRRWDWRRHLRSLRLAHRFGDLIESQEYTPFSGIFPLHLPPLDIELDATPEQLARMLARIEKTWTKLADERPHHSVLTQTRFKPENVDASADSFWESGEVEVRTTAALLRQIGLNPGTRICVEYGCGLGRVTVPLAGEFAKVHAYDISANHLAMARQRSVAMGAGNIVFHHRGNGLLEPLEACDFFYSRLVFQHNPPPIIRELVGLALRSLAPGGVAIFGVPVYWLGYRFRIDEYLAEAGEPGMEMHCIPQREVFSLIAAEGCSLIDVREERTLAVGFACLSNLFVVQRSSAG
jgi:SAM-dependent methyltransferase